MTLEFLTPIGAVVAAGAIVPFAALAVNERRARQVRRTLGLAEPTLTARLPSVVALALVPGLLGLALAQPILRSTRALLVRKDAQIFYVFDTSESMRAARSRGGPTRLDRALAAAGRMRLSLQDVPSGIATMTDRILPDLFPTASEQVFEATLGEAVGVDRPPPKGLAERATTYAALDTLTGTNFFGAGIKHRLVILFTDGETAPYFAGDLREALRRPPRTSFVILRFWRSSERILTTAGADSRYRPDPSSAQAVRTLAATTGGRAYGEGSVGHAIGAARQSLGRGPVANLGQDLHVIALSRWLALAALVPLAFLLWRRNLM
jgi:hypothetical protein